MAPDHLILDRFTWNRQPSSDWPRWLVAKNWATGPSGDLIVHGFDEILVFRPGDVVGLLATSDAIRL